MTNRAFLRSISRVDAYHTNAGHDCFVVDKLPELTETPRAMSMSLGPGLDRCPLSNALEVFQNNQGRGAFGFHNKFLGDAMVGVSSKPCFMTGKLLEMLFSAVGTTTLHRCSEIIEFDSSLVDLFTDIMINKRLQLDFIGGLHLKSNFCYIITRCIELMHGLKESLGLLWFNCNFDFESLHHDSIDIYCLWHKYLTYGRAQFLRTLKDAASLGDEVKNY